MNPKHGEKTCADDWGEWRDWSPRFRMIPCNSSESLYWLSDRMRTFKRAKWNYSECVDALMGPEIMGLMNMGVS
jgi:hypothetical protein